MRRSRQSHEAYRRELPGGGYVAIEVWQSRTFFGQRSFHGHVVVERREPERRNGHEPPIVAEANAPDLDTLLQQLFPVAHSNTAVAVGLPRRTGGHSMAQDNTSALTGFFA